MIGWLVAALISAATTVYCIGKAMEEYAKEQAKKYEEEKYKVYA